MVDELKESPLSEMMVKMVESRMVCQSDWPEVMKQEYGRIVDALRSEPATLRDYVAKQRCYNQLQWAHEIVSRLRVKIPYVFIVHCELSSKAGIRTTLER